MKIFGILLVALLLGKSLSAMQKHTGNTAGWAVSALRHARVADCDSIILTDGRVIIGRVIDSGTTTLTVRYCHEDKAEVLDRLAVDRIVYGLAGPGTMPEYQSERYRRLIGWGIGLVLGSIVLAYPLLILALLVSFAGGPEFFAILMFLLLVTAFVVGIVLLVQGMVLKFNKPGI